MRLCPLVRLSVVAAGLLMTGGCATDSDPAPDSAAARALRAQLRETVVAYQKILPLRVHDKGELVQMTADDLVLTLVFRFEGQGWSTSGADADAADRAARDMMVGLGCASPSISDFLAQGAVVRYRFQDADDTAFFQHDLSAADCTS